MLFSRNHTDGSWATRAPRRLRNVVAAMEWVPRADGVALTEASVSPGALTEGQEVALRQAFVLLDIDDSGRLDAQEVKELLAAVHSDVDIGGLLAAADADGSGDFDFEEVARALRSQALHQVQAGRYFVALSLREAETLRALIHAVEGGSLVEGASAFAALRVGGTLLDASHGYEAAPPPQTLAAEAALRFVNSDVEFAPPPLNALLRALNANTPEMRAAWWLRVRGHRRRSRRDWRAAAL